MALLSLCSSSHFSIVSFPVHTERPHNKLLPLSRKRSQTSRSATAKDGQNSQTKFRGSNESLESVSRQSGIEPPSLTLFSPAKINLFLRITSKRADGYHNLASLFHAINLGDTLQFTASLTSSGDSLSTNAQGVPLDQRNLIIKALNLYREKTGFKQIFQIHLDKRIPTGAGLGGGSSNAATALWAANHFNNHTATIEELQKWSAEIGSDIPFFFSHGAAYCTGRGELFHLKHASQADPVQLLEEISKNGICQNVCINDLESPAFELCPLLKSLKQQSLEQNQGQYAAVFMSGSGSTIVGVGDLKPPLFINYRDDNYHDMFITGAYFLTRKENYWYQK